MKKLFVTILALTLSASIFPGAYKVRNYCEDCVAFKFTTQAVLDEDWKAAGCEAHTTRDFTALEHITGIIIADQGYILLPSGQPDYTGAQVQPVSAVDKVNAIQVFFDYRLKISDIILRVDLAEADKYFGCGIYTVDGEILLLETGAISMASTGKKKVTLGTSVTLEAGVYWFAWTGDGTVMRLRGIAPGAVLNDLFNDTVPQSGRAANSGSAGALPATLGPITYLSFSPPVVLMKP